MAITAPFPRTEFPCNTYPAVGHTSGVDGLSVVVAPGPLLGRDGAGMASPDENRMKTMGKW